MAYFLKGNETSFIFEKADIKHMLDSIFELDLVLYKLVVHSYEEQAPLDNIDAIDMNYAYYFVVPKSEIQNVSWRTVELVRGGVNYHFDNLNSRAIKFYFSPQSQNKIEIGNISITTQWENDYGEIQEASFEKDVYKSIQSIIRKSSVGKINGIFIGENAYKIWDSNKVELGQGNLSYSKEFFKFTRKNMK
jgi:hypothetical protein